MPEDLEPSRREEPMDLNAGRARLTEEEAAVLTVLAGWTEATTAAVYPEGGTLTPPRALLLGLALGVVLARTDADAAACALTTLEQAFGSARLPAVHAQLARHLAARIRAASGLA